MSATEDGDTFADVLNGFSLRGRRGHRPDDRPAPTQPVATVTSADDGWDGQNAASVRAYMWTGGRTHSDRQLEIETLVSTSDRADALMPTLRTEHQAVARLCYLTKSVAEVAALLELPLGVVRVLLGDMASLGLITVHRNDFHGDEPDLELLARVLRGLTHLRPAPPPAPRPTPVADPSPAGRDALPAGGSAG
jgi:hypothetical protein